MQVNHDGETYNDGDGAEPSIIIRMDIGVKQTTKYDPDTFEGAQLCR